MSTVCPKPFMMRILLVALVAALAGLLFGLDLGVISGALPFISQSMGLSLSQQGWIPASVLFGAALGAVVSAFFSDQYGRRNSLIASALLFGLSSIISGYSMNFTDLLISVRYAKRVVVMTPGRHLLYVKNGWIN